LIVFPQAAFGKRTFVQLEFSPRRHSFTVENPRLGDFFNDKKEVKIFYDGWTEEEWYESKK